MRTFEKANVEEVTLGIDFTNRLGIAASVASGTVSAILVSDSSDATSTVLDGTTATIVGKQAQFRVKAGTSGALYRVTLLATMGNSDIFQEQLDLVIK